METWKWFVVGAAALALALVALMAVPVEKSSPDTHTVITQGRFTVLQGGRIVAEEDYRSYQVGDGILLRGECAIASASGTVRLVHQLTLGEHGTPRAYDLAVHDGEALAHTVEVSVHDDEVTISFDAADQIHTHSLPTQGQVFILDNNLMSHWIPLYTTLQGEGAPLTGTAVIPQALAALPLIADEPTDATLITETGEFPVKRYPIRLGDIRAELFGQDDLLMAVRYPAQYALAWRTELFPEGVEIAYEEPDRLLPEGVIEVPLTFSSNAVELSGTLTVPEEAAKPYPAALFVHGSGPLDRDANAPGLATDIFRDLAHHLAVAGVGSLRYDKRGVGESGGELHTAGLSDLVSDAREALHALAQHEAIDGDQLYVLGHSEGGYIAPLLADEPGVQGLVLIATAAQPLSAVTRWQVEQLARMDGKEGEALAEILTAQDQFIAFVEGSEGTWDQYTFEELRTEMPWLSPEQLSELHTQPLVWLREHSLHCPATALEAVDVPVLVLHGEKDLQIPHQEAARIADTLTAAGNEDVTVRVLPDLNHLLRHHPGQPTLWHRHLDQPVDERVRSIVEHWMLGAQ